MLAAAVIESPIPGSTLTMSDVTFSWSDEGDVRYILEVGTTVQGDDIHDSGLITTTSHTVSNVPTDARVYIRLWTESATGSNLYFTRTFVYNGDIDSDGIDDTIDPQPGTTNSPIVLTGSDHTLTVLGSERLASMQVSQALFDDFADGMSSTQMREMTQRVYEHFEDDFDFILFTSYQDSGPGYSGTNFGVKNDTDGIGQNLYDSTANFGSDGALQSAIHLKSAGMLEGGPSLHELMHRWATFLDSVATTSSGHWGYSSANGQLGGWDPATFEDLGNNNYSADPFGTFANGGNSLAYSDRWTRNDRTGQPIFIVNCHRCNSTHSRRCRNQRGNQRPRRLTCGRSTNELANATQRYSLASRDI
jgi:hypothetical protein